MKRIQTYMKQMQRALFFYVSSSEFLSIKPLWWHSILDICKTIGCSKAGFLHWKDYSKLLYGSCRRTHAARGNKGFPSNVWFVLAPIFYDVHLKKKNVKVALVIAPKSSWCHVRRSQTERSATIWNGRQDAAFWRAQRWFWIDWDVFCGSFVSVWKAFVTPCRDKRICAACVELTGGLYFVKL